MMGKSSWKLVARVIGKRQVNDSEAWREKGSVNRISNFVNYAFNFFFNVSYVRLIIVMAGKVQNSTDRLKKYTKNVHLPYVV